MTGTSVLGLTFAGGVLLAADTLGSYGSTKRYKSFERLLKVNDAVVVAAGGELSDFQYIARWVVECWVVGRCCCRFCWRCCSYWAV